jgi:hypothetical protein
VAPDSSIPPSQRQRSRPGPSLARAWRIVFVAMVLALIPVLAAASPPDPAWIGGIYDAADGDEIVTLIGDQAGSPGVAGYAICQPLPLPLALHEMESCTAQGFSKQRLIRGPPPGSCTRIAAPPPRCAGPRQPALHPPTSDRESWSCAPAWPPRSAMRRRPTGRCGKPSTFTARSALPAMPTASRGSSS